MGRRPKSAANNPMSQSPSVPGNSRSECEANERAARRVRKKASKIKATYTRRSERLQNSSRCAQDQQIETVNEPIYVVDSEREDELDIIQNDEPIPCEKSLEEKVNQLVEDVEMLKSIVNERDFSSAGSSELNYKSLYIRSQKKIQSLAYENGQLSNKLQTANAKIKEYQKTKHLVDKLMEAMNSNLAKVTEEVAEISRFVFPKASAQPDHAAVVEDLTKSKRHRKGG